MLHCLRNIYVIIICLPLCNLAIYAASFHTGPIECGIGSWINFPVNRDAYSAYNKLSVDGYFSYGKLKGYIGAPILYTLDKKDSKKVNGEIIPASYYKGATALGDLNMYIGFQIGTIQPRIGVIVPLGYPTNSGVWLGSKNVILKAGTGFSGDVSKRLHLRLGGEIYVKYYICGYPEMEDALGKAGSWAIEPDLKLTTQPFKKWRFAIEALGGFKKFYPVWLKYGSFQGYELSSSIVPHLSVSYDVKSRLYISAKAGCGPGFKRKVEYKSEQPWKKSGYAINIGVGMGFYP